MEFMIIVAACDVDLYQFRMLLFVSLVYMFKCIMFVNNKMLPRQKLLVVCCSKVHASCIRGSVLYQQLSVLSNHQVTFVVTQLQHILSGAVVIALDWYDRCLGSASDRF